MSRCGSPAIFQSLVIIQNKRGGYIACLGDFYFKNHTNNRRKVNMNIHSTDEERYLELVDKEISIVQDTSKTEIVFGLNYNDRGQSQIWKDTQEYIVEVLKLKNTVHNIPEIDVPVVINENSITESISNTNKNKEALYILSKAFSNIDEICKNAILLNVDKYQYFWKNKAKIIEAVYFYVSLLKLDNEVYPIEIIIEKRIKSKKESFHLIISTEKIKEDVLMAGMHVDNATESQPLRDTSSILKLSQVVTHFNQKHSVLLKHFPDKMLTQEQVIIKSNSKEHDKNRIEKILRKDMLKALDALKD